MAKSSLAVATILVAFALISCSGGGGTGGSPAPAAPSLELLAGVPPGGRGSSDGPGSVARFNQPEGITADANGNLFVADTLNGSIRKITPQLVVSTVASGFDLPIGVAVDLSGSVYVADAGKNVVHRIGSDGALSIYAGNGIAGSVDGPAASAQFHGPAGLAFDQLGNLYVADVDNDTIRRISPQGMVTTVAGAAGQRGSNDGPALDARFGSLGGIASDRAGGLYIADAGNALVRHLTAAGNVVTVAGRNGVFGTEDGVGSNATFKLPMYLASDAAGNVFVSDRENYAFRKVTPAGLVTTLQGMPDLLASSQNLIPHALAIAGNGDIAFADSESSTILSMSASGAVTTLAGQSPSTGMGLVDGIGADARFTSARAAATDAAGLLYVWDGTTVRTVARDGKVSTLATLPALASPAGLAVDALGNIYAASSSMAAARGNVPASVYRISAATGIASPMPVGGSSDGSGSLDFVHVGGIAVDAAGNAYLADSARILRVSPAGDLTTFAGSGGAGSADGIGRAAQFANIVGIAFDASGDLIAADVGNHCLRRITPAGEVTSFAREALFGGRSDTAGSTPWVFALSGLLAIDGKGRVLVTDRNTVRLVTPDGRVSTLAGVVGRNGFVPGPLPASLAGPSGIAATGSDVYLTMGTGVAVIRGVP